MWLCSEDGYNGMPCCMYSLSPSTTADKIIAVMLYHMPVRRKEVTAEEKENILLVLTNNGYLKVMSADTSSVLRSIFLSTITKYRDFVKINEILATSMSGMQKQSCQLCEKRIVKHFLDQHCEILIL